MTAAQFLSLEDHFVSSVCQQDEVTETLDLRQFPDAILHRLLDVGQLRREAMDAGRVGLQVVSHIPVVLDLKGCQQANDELNDHVKKGNSRFVAFAALPMAQPASISAELERCITERQFVGALIPNHADGTYYDGEDYITMWQTAERLGVPIYLHPCPPSAKTRSLFGGNYSAEVDYAIGTHAWDWHANCGMHFVRLYASGLFDRCPKLKIVLGHLGEMIPGMLGRVERKLALTKDKASWQTSFREVWKRNVWVTTSGMFDVAAFRLTLATTSIGRIMFSVDYPFESTNESVEFLEDLERTGVLTSEQLALIARTNAEGLLGVHINDTAI